MALDNETELRLKITTDKQSLTVLNGEIKKSIADIQGSYRSLNESIKAQNKIEVESIKTTGKVKQSEIKKETELRKAELNKQIADVKLANDLKIAQDKIAYQEYVRQSNKQLQIQKQQQQQLAAENKKYTGQSTTLGSLDSVKQQISYFTQLRNTLPPTSAEFAKYNSKIQELTRSKKELLSATQSSRAQLLEMGENIATVALGLVGLIAGLTGAAKEIWNLSKAGAEFGVLKSNFIELAGSEEEAQKQMELFRRASSGNLDDKQIVEYAAKYKLLGFTLIDSARLMAAVESRGDQMNVTFEQGQRALEQYILTGRAKGLKELGINIASAESNFKRLTDATGQSKDSLSDEELQAIRTKVVLKELGGETLTLQQIMEKQQDSADKIAAVGSAWENVKLQVGQVFSEKIVSGMDKMRKDLEGTSFALSDQEDILTVVTKKYFEWAEYIDKRSPVRAMLDITTSLNTSFNSISGYITEGIKDVQNYFQTFDRSPNTAWSGSIINALKDVTDWAKDAANWLYKVLNLEDDAKTGLSTRSITDNIIDGITDKVSKLPPKKKVADGGFKDKDKSTGRGSDTSDISKTLDEIQQLEVDLKSLQDERLAFITAYGQTSGIVYDNEKKILEIETKLDYLRTGKKKPEPLKLNLGDEDLTEIDKSLLFSDAELIQMQKIEEQGKQMTDALIEQSKVFQQSWAEVISSIASGMGDLFGVMASGGDSGEAFKGFMKSIVGTFITSVQAMLIASNAALLAKGITSWGISLITDAPMLAAGWLALEAAKGFIGALYTGGTLRPGEMALVGDDKGRITPNTELIYANTGMNVLSNRDLMQALSSTRGGSSNSPNVVVKVSGLLRDLVKVGIEQNNKREAILSYS